MRRRGRRPLRVAPLLGLAVLVGLPGAAWTAGLVMPVPKVGLTHVAYVKYTATQVGDATTTGTNYTTMVVNVAAPQVTQAKGDVRIRVKPALAAETGWSSCVADGGTHWRCTFSVPLTSGQPTLSSSVALP